MKNVFLIGNGFDLHHKLPTKYFDFMCVAEYLITNTLYEPINVGDIFSKCTKSRHIEECYDAHKDVFNNIHVPFEEVSKIEELLKNNMWFDYFLKTFDVDSGWIDFEKEISTVITILDESIDEDQNVVNLSAKELLPAFILSSFKFFIDIDDKTEIYPGGDFEIKKDYLREYPHNSGIYRADKKKIFNDLYNELLNFSRTLSIYLSSFVESAYEGLHKDKCTREQRINLLNLADNAVSFNYTKTFERFYFNKSAYHIHGMASDANIVLGVNANKSDDCGTNNTSLIKFKKYYQREVFGTVIEYVKWYREIIKPKRKYRVITIGHSLDETDKDIISDMFFNAEEIYVTYYDDDCKDNYIANIIKIFGNDGYNKFLKEQGLEFVALSDIEQLNDRIKPMNVN